MLLGECARTVNDNIKPSLGPVNIFKFYGPHLIIREGSNALG